MAFHSGDVMSELEAVKLSGAEKEALLGVMQRAKVTRGGGEKHACRISYVIIMT